MSVHGIKVLIEQSIAPQGRWSWGVYDGLTMVDVSSRSFDTAAEAALNAAIYAPAIIAAAERAKNPG